MSQNPQEKIAHQRLGVLEFAEALGNVSSACRQRGMTRRQYYDYISAALSSRAGRDSKTRRQYTRAIPRTLRPRWWSASWRSA